MPGLLKSNDTTVALCCQPEQNHVPDENGVPHVTHRVPPQPRQPRGLQGLLQFAMEATRSEDGAGPSNLGPVDEERRKFLEDALKSMTIDVIEVLLKQIKVFDNVGTVTATSSTNEYCQAFDTILDYTATFYNELN